MSALESAGRIVRQEEGSNDWGSITDVASALIKACEALEPFAEIELSSLYSDADDEMYHIKITDRPAHRDFSRKDVLRARAALSCSAPPEDKQGADTKL